jgi:hypothetical protein
MRDCANHLQVVIGAETSIGRNQPASWPSATGGVHAIRWQVQERRFDGGRRGHADGERAP